MSGWKPEKLSNYISCEGSQYIDGLYCHGLG